MGEKSRMTKVVFFSDSTRLVEALGYFDTKGFRGKTVPVKLHMGEKGNKYFPRPALAKQVVEVLQAMQAEPFLHDTTVAYSGERHTKTGYRKLASVNGFTRETIGCDVVIDDTGVPTIVDGRSYEVADHLKQATHIFALTHVKGHIQSGMGGAIKNFGMGGVTKETKIQIHHGSRPLYQKDACTLCGVCAEVCPFESIAVTDQAWKYDKHSCFGCGVCVDACKNKAIRYQDADMQYLLACSAKACVQDKNVLYLNELKRIARGCDCDPAAGPIICPDIGYLVADDPVAIDQASLDLIHEVRPNIFERKNKVSPLKQIKYGEEIGLGSSSYELIEL
jgi:uncharacterized Fe-S center protein